MNDPRLRGGPKTPRRDAEKSVEEGLDVLRDAIRDLLAKPKEQREEHLNKLKDYVQSLLPEFESIDRNSASARRLRAMERVIATLEEVSARS